jgi:hypothetical protein
MSIGRIKKHKNLEEIKKKLSNDPQPTELIISAPAIKCQLQAAEGNCVFDLFMPALQLRLLKTLRVHVGITVRPIKHL